MSQLADNFKNIKGKSLKIISTEEEMISFANDCAKFTAYMLSIQNHQELPSLDTIKRAAAPYKLFLCKKLSNKLSKVIEPKNISMSSLNTVMCGGYFKVSCSLSLFNEKNEVVSRQLFNISFVDETGLPLAMKITQVYRNKYPDISIEEIVKEITFL